MIPQKVIRILNVLKIFLKIFFMRVYGALMWSLGKVYTTPEVPRVFIGSFWNEPFLHNRKL